MKYLHRNGVVHRDLKTLNILLHRGRDEEWTCKIADFGAARRLKYDTKAPNGERRRIFMPGISEPTLMSTFVGTICFMAPEILEYIEVGNFLNAPKADHCEYDFPADVYSYGCVLWELISYKDIWAEIPLIEVR